MNWTDALTKLVHRVRPHSARRWNGYWRVWFVYGFRLAVCDPVRRATPAAQEDFREETAFVGLAVTNPTLFRLRVRSLSSRFPVDWLQGSSVLNTSLAASAQIAFDLEGYEVSLCRCVS